MISSGCDFDDKNDFIAKYFSLDRIPHVEKRLLDHPLRAGKFPGPRNAEGYRGDSFDERGDLNIVFLGCSWVEGSGVSYEALFSNRLKSKLEAATHLSVKSWNLGLAAMGMDYMVRMAPIACRTLRPDLAVVVCTWGDRREFFTRDRRRIAFYRPLPHLVRNGRFSVEDRDKTLLDAYETLSNDYQDIACLLSTIRSLEGIFDSASIPWVYSWIDKRQVSEPMEFLTDAGVLPTDHFLGSCFRRIDFASAINKHPGIHSHDLFATTLCDRILRPETFKAVMKPKDRAMQSTASRIKIPSKSSRVQSAIARLFRRRKPSKQAPDDDENMYPLW